MTRALRRGVLGSGAMLSGAGALAGAVAVAASSSHGSRPDRGSGAPVFQDQFNGTRLDSARWGTCYWWGGCTISSNHELEWYQAGQVRLSRGAAQLVAARRKVRGTNGHVYQYVSGMIDSGPPPGTHASKFAFLYGRLRTRVRIPAGRGLWSALWLLPANRDDLPEIDVFESIGRDPAHVQMHLHYRGPSGAEVVTGATRALRPAGGWHVYELDWSPGHLRWLIDGVPRWQVTGAAVPSQPMYVIADLAVGGDWAGAPGSDTRFPSALQIDWIRVTK